MPERWLVWGGGGHGRVVADAIRSAGGLVVGYIDRRALDDTTLDEATFVSFLATNQPLPLGATRIAFGIGDNSARAQAASTVPSAYGEAVLHPTAFVAEGVSLGMGTVVLPKAIVQIGAHVGAGAIVNSGAIIEHDCVLGPFVHISPGAVLSGGVRVETEAWIGANAVIIPGVTIGARSTVGAGSVVLRDVPPDVIVAGNPSRLLRHREGAVPRATVSRGDADPGVAMAAET